MGDYSQFFNCSIGTAAFQLTDYAYKSDPVVKEGVGLTSTKIAITGEGWLQAEDAESFGEAIAALMAAFERPGQSLQINGLAGVTEVSLSASQCLDGGPFISYEMRKGSPDALRRDFGFTVNATTFADPSQSGGGSGPAGYKTTTQVRPDELRVVSRAGELTGPDSVATFQTSILPAFQALYSLPKWVVTYQYDLSGGTAVTKSTYTLNAEEQQDDLPAAVGVTAVQGTGSTRTDRDEQMRRVTVTEVNLLVEGDPQKLLTLIRPKGVNVVILRESVSITMYRERRLTASFTILDGGNGNDLMDWSQTFRVSRAEADTFDANEYIGPRVGPLLFKKPQGVQRYVQSGRAVGAGRFPRPADPIYPSYSEPSVLNFNAINRVEMETTWTYSFIFEAEPNSGTVGGGFNPIVAVLADRPANPTFY